MIYGYYCIHPELVGEHYKVAGRQQRLDKLTELGAPEIILANEKRVLDELITMQSDIRWFRDRIKKLYEDDTQNNILENYRVVLEDDGFDAAIAYSGHVLTFDDDYLKPLDTLNDDELRGFLAYVQSKFDAYHEKYAPKLFEIREQFISRIKQYVDNGTYPKYILQNLERLKRAAIEIDDGFTTTVEESAGWFNACRNVIVLAARAFDGKNPVTLFHECFHGIAGRTDPHDGFNRLAVFFGDEYEDAYNFLNEAFTNAQSYSVLTGNPPEWMKAEQIRDSKIESIIRRTGTTDIPREIYFNAYFSDNIADVKALADAITAVFSPAELFGDLQSIKDIHSVEEMKHTGESSKKAKNLRKEHRFDNIGTYFHYRYFDNMTEERLGQMLSEMFKKPRSEEKGFD